MLPLPVEDRRGGERTPLGVLRQVFGFDSFRGQQLAIIEHVIAGGDAVVLMPTGGGKSLCYQVPALLRPGLGVVVSPLIALMKDQVDALRQAGVRAAALNSRLSPGEAVEIEHAVRDAALDLLYMSPERLITPRCLELLSQSRLALFAIDEAHCISQWGHDFRPEYQQLSVLKERFPGVPLLALTATADAPTRRDIIAQLRARPRPRSLPPGMTGRTCSTVSCPSSSRWNNFGDFSPRIIPTMPGSSTAPPGRRSRTPLGGSPHVDAGPSPITPVSTLRHASVTRSTFSGTKAS